MDGILYMVQETNHPVLNTLRKMGGGGGVPPDGKEIG
jgi:hypothetical protein